MHYLLYVLQLLIDLLLGRSTPQLAPIPVTAPRYRREAEGRLPRKVPRDPRGNWKMPPTTLSPCESSRCQIGLWKLLMWKTCPRSLSRAPQQRDAR